jgi:hypothetical protein
MSKEMPVIPSYKVVDTKRTIGKNGGLRRRGIRGHWHPHPHQKKNKCDRLLKIFVIFSQINCPLCFM